MGEAKRRRERQEELLKGREHRRTVFERVRQATVGFAVVQEKRPPSIVGSGVVVDRKGIILTARHVVEELEIAVFRQRREPGKTRVTALVLGNSQLSLKTEDDGKESAKLDFQYTGVPLNEVRLSNRGDLAAVRTDGSQVALADLKLDPRHEVLEGDPVATCGWPYGIQLHEGKTILSSFLLGHVSAVVPHPALPPRHRGHYLMQLPVNPGNSGGPVFDPDTGEVYGIVSRRFEPKGIPAGLCVVEPVVRVMEAIADW
jgi:S1-C subfamily serine protease